MKKKTLRLMVSALVIGALGIGLVGCGSSAENKGDAKKAETTNEVSGSITVSGSSCITTTNGKDNWKILVKES